MTLTARLLVLLVFVGCTVAQAHERVAQPQMLTEPGLEPVRQKGELRHTPRDAGKALALPLLLRHQRGRWREPRDERNRREVRAEERRDHRRPGPVHAQNRK